jgi:predicted DNA-binding transcriptional regulator AlpA
MTPTVLEPLLDPAAVARLAGLQLRTIYLLNRRGRMPPCVGPSARRLRWTVDAIRAWLAQSPRGGPSRDA